MQAKILNGGISIFLIILFTTISSLHGLDLFGRSVRYMSVDETPNSICEFIMNIDQVLNEIENSTDPFDVSWTYGYLSSLFSAENDKLKAIIDAYNQGKLQVLHARTLFNCLKGFIQKLTLSNYIYDQNINSSYFKNKYLPATEDLRSIMESGILLSLYMFDLNQPEILKERFLVTYDKRERISDPVNTLFDILSPKTNGSNSMNEIDFLMEIPDWTECDSSFSKLSRLLAFIHSIQRYLISGLFAEEIHLLMRFQDDGKYFKVEKYLKQLENHRRQYKTISQLLANKYSQCYTSLTVRKENKLLKNKKC